MKDRDNETEVKTMVLKHRRKGETRTVLQKLNPADPRDAELIQEHHDAIRHGHGIVINIGEKLKVH